MRPVILFFCSISVAACSSPEDAQVLRHTITEVDGLVRHDIVYGSDGLRIHGQAVVPAEPGPWPVLLFNHGGFSGMGGDDFVRLDDMARSGVAVFASEYRGEGKSQGEVEYCAGEVDDVSRFAEVAEGIDNVDTSAVVAMGFSHGACISLFLRDRLPALRGTVTMGTPTEIDVHIQWHRDRGNDAFADRWAKYVGDDGYQKSPLYTTHAPPLVMLHGSNDPTVPPMQACMLFEKLVADGWSGGLHRYNSDGEPSPGGIAGCANDADGVLASDDPASVDGVVLGVYQDVEHAPNATVWDAALAQAHVWLR